MTELTPWRCKYCVRMVSAQSAYCGGCWGHWNLCNDSTYVHKRKVNKTQTHNEYATDWSASPWTEDDGGWPKSPRRRAQSRTQSPRKRSLSARARAQNADWNQSHGPAGGKGKEKGEKGKTFEKGGASAFGHLPPSTQWLTPPAIPFAADPSATATSSTPSTTSQVMQPFGKSRTEKEKEDLNAELIALRNLKQEIQKEKQTEEVKKALAVVEASVRKEDSKNYKQLVGLLEKARKKLSDIEEQWETFRNQWATYLDNAQKMWISHIDSYEEGETKFAQKRREAAETVQQVRAQLHDVHVRTMALEGVSQGELQEGQSALDATMIIEDLDDVIDPPQFAQLRDDLKGVVQRVKDSIEEKMTKRTLSVRERDGEDVQILEPADKKQNRNSDQP